MRKPLSTCRRGPALLGIDGLQNNSPHCATRHLSNTLLGTSTSGFLPTPKRLLVEGWRNSIPAIEAHCLTGDDTFHESADNNPMKCSHARGRLAVATAKLHACFDLGSVKSGIDRYGGIPRSSTSCAAHKSQIAWAWQMVPTVRIECVIDTYFFLIDSHSPDSISSSTPSVFTRYLSYPMLISVWTSTK